MPPFALVLISAAAVLGVLAATQGLPPDRQIAVGAGLLALSAFACSGSCKPPQFRALLLAALVAAALDASLHARSERVVSERRTARYAGTVLDGAGTSLTIALDDGIRVLAHVRDPGAPAGSRVVVGGRLVPFDEARNPGDRALQRERGIDAQLESATLQSSRAGSWRDARAWLARAHAWAHAQLAQRLGEPFASVAGELWGERSVLPPDLRAEFQKTGTVHVLVTAGLHFAAVVAVALGILSLFSLPRTLTCGLAIACIWGFVWWSGAALPAVRAATMATAALLGKACGRATLSWNALALAALAVAFLRPESVATPSFALSFSCVGAIFACAGPTNAGSMRRRNSPRGFGKHWCCRWRRSWGPGR